MNSLKTKYSKSKVEKMNKMIFVSSCIESAARQCNLSAAEMYQRMKRVGLVEGVNLRGYGGLHTQSRQQVTEDVLGARAIWETKKGIAV